MSLTEYRRKRRFDQTREPEPGRSPPPGGRAIFVVQLHHASRRHYDFRLQVGDALKSWAVPKGPSYDPAVKRMAVEVEDHPLDYAEFQGRIPEGHYGGGHVARFDQGVWAAEGDAEAQLAKGHLRFELFGKKLKGGWHLVRSGRNGRQPQWLLFKDQDEYAGTLEADDLLADVTAPPPRDLERAGRGKPRRKRLAEVSVARRRRRDWARQAARLAGARRARAPEGAFDLQLAMLADAPPTGEAWVHELKWDGYRLGVVVRDGKARLWSRNALEWTGKVPEIAAAVERLGLREAVLDGELVAGGGGKQDFALLQATLSGEKQGRLTLVLFDLLHVDGIDLSEAPLTQRKALLERLLDPAPAHLAYSSHGHDGEQSYRLATEQGFEGVVSKRGDRPYRGGRGDDWRKSKSVASDEFAVVGYTAPKGSRTGFGALLLARPDPRHGWVYAGRVGSGFSQQQTRQLARQLGPGRAEPSVHVPPNDTDLRSARWFAPAWVVEVFYRGQGGHGLLRQPSLKALRLDKRAEDLTDRDRGAAADGSAAGPSTARRSTAASSTRGSSTTGSSTAGRSPAHPSPAGASTTSRSRSARATAPRSAEAPAQARQSVRGRRRSLAAAAAAAQGESFRLTSPGRVVYPDRGLTKREVADYYAQVSDWLLPEIAGRPLSVIRCPQGAARPCFFQKHHTAGLEQVDAVRLEEESGRHGDYLVVRDAAALMELVQFNALEFHPWGALAEAPDRADRMVFDLDPGPGVAWEDVVAAARRIRILLRGLGLVSYVRTSGGKGLHVVVPLNPGCDWAQVKPFAHGFADALAAMEPLSFVATATKKFRKGKIFVDYLRNGRGATSVASFSLRARPGAPVAMPLRWEELSKLAHAAAFDIDSARARLKRLRRHPWHGIEAVRQDLDEVGERLAELSPGVK